MGSMLEELGKVSPSVARFCCGLREIDEAVGGKVQRGVREVKPSGRLG